MQSLLEHSNSIMSWNLYHFVIEGWKQGKGYKKSNYL
jgi:hypothetical protein